MSLLVDLKSWLKVRLVYPRRHPSCRIESVLPAGLAVARGLIVRRGVYLSPTLETLGRHCYLGEGASVLACRRIGPFSCLSQGARIGLPPHELDHVGTSHLFSRAARGWVAADTGGARATPPAEIGADVLVSANVLVLAGVTIGHGAVVGAGAVVTGDVPPYAIAVGIPARVTGHRFEPDLREALLASRWWERTDEEIRALRDRFPRPREFLNGLGPGTRGAGAP